MMCSPLHCVPSKWRLIMWIPFVRNSTKVLSLSFNVFTARQQSGEDYDFSHVFLSVYRSSGGSKGGCPLRAPPYGRKFPRFHAVFGKIWQNRMLVPRLESRCPLLQGILDPPLMRVPVEGPERWPPSSVQGLAPPPNCSILFNLDFTMQYPSAPTPVVMFKLVHYITHAVRKWSVGIWLKRLLVTARKQSLGQGNIFTPVCHSVHGERVPGQIPPRSRYTPLEQVHPLGPGTPQHKVHPLGRGTPPGTRYPFPPGPGTPRTRYTTRIFFCIFFLFSKIFNQLFHHLFTPQQCMLEDTGNKRAVRILLECILVFNCF